MEKYRVYSHGRKNVVEVGVGGGERLATGFNDFFSFFDIFALKKKN